MITVKTISEDWWEVTQDSTEPIYVPPIDVVSSLLRLGASTPTHRFSLPATKECLLTRFWSSPPTVGIQLSFPAKMHSIQVQLSDYHASMWEPYFVRDPIELPNSTLRIITINAKLPKRSWLIWIDPISGWLKEERLVLHHGGHIRRWAGGNVGESFAPCWGNNDLPENIWLPSLDSLFFDSVFNNDLIPGSRDWTRPPSVWGVSAERPYVSSRYLCSKRFFLDAQITQALSLA